MNILITRATSGIGHNLWEHYVSSGQNIIIVGRRKELLDNMARNFPEHTHSVLCYRSMAVIQSNPLMSFTGNPNLVSYGSYDAGLNDGTWKPMMFGTIEYFQYEKGVEYELSVIRTTLSEPSADGTSFGTAQSVVSNECSQICNFAA